MVTLDGKGGFSSDRNGFDEDAWFEQGEDPEVLAAIYAEGDVVRGRGVCGEEADNPAVLGRMPAGPASDLGEIGSLIDWIGADECARVPTPQELMIPSSRVNCAGSVSSGTRMGTLFLLLSVLASSCGGSWFNKKDLNQTPYGSYFQKMTFPDLDDYAGNDDFKTFFDVIMQLYFDKNITEGDKAALMKLAAKLKTRNPVFPNKYKTWGYDYDRSDRYGGYARKEVYKADNGVPADKYEDVIEVAADECQEALQELNDVLDDYKKAKENLAKEPNQDDYDDYYDALKRAGASLSQALKVFPLANAYVLAEAFLMFAEYGISASDLEEVGVNLNYLKNVLEAEGEQHCFEKYLLESFRDDVESGYGHDVTIARSLTGFVSDALPNKIRSFSAAIEQIIREGRLKRKASEKGGKDVSSEKKAGSDPDSGSGQFAGKHGAEGDMEGTVSDDPEAYDADTERLRGLLVTFKNDVIPRYLEIFTDGTGAPKNLEQMDFDQLIEYAREVARFKESDLFVELKAEYGYLKPIIENNPKLRKMNVEGIDYMVIDFTFTSMRLGDLSLDMELGKVMDQVDIEKYKNVTPSNLHAIYESAEALYFLPFAEKVRRFEDGDYSFEMIAVDLREAVYYAKPIMVAVLEWKRKAQYGGLEGLSQSEILALSRVEMGVAAFREVAEKLKKVAGARMHEEGGGGSYAPPAVSQEREVVSNNIPSYGDFVSFEAEVLNVDGTHLVEIMADWCPACKVSGAMAVEPYAQAESSKENEGVHVVRINTEAVSDKKLAEWLMANGLENSIPVYMVVQDGKVVGYHRGAFRSENEVRQFMKKFVGIAI